LIESNHPVPLPSIEGRQNSRLSVLVVLAADAANGFLIILIISVTSLLLWFNLARLPGGPSSFINCSVAGRKITSSYQIDNVFYAHLVFVWINGLKVERMIFA